MPGPALSLSFDTDFEPDTGRAVVVAPGVARVTAPNASPYTFTGTNSFILGESRVAVLDPGPDDPRHLEALIASIGGRPVDAILLTHTHRDHSALARRLASHVKAPLWFEGPHRPSRQPLPFERDWVGDHSDNGLEPDRRLADGDVLDLGGLDVEVVATPGHCANHLCFGLRGRPEMLSGDHVMGWNSTMIAVPDGSMADYLQSLRKVEALPYRGYLPAHGGAIPDGREFARLLRLHREFRNKEVVRAVEKGARSIGDLLRVIYPTVPLAVVPAARMTLKSHVEYLAGLGRLKATRRGFGIRLSI
jgi:glyoxylase-like metal-dependent hydrolase (beta-lactamase superfamily II)